MHTTYAVDNFMTMEIIGLDTSSSPASEILTPLRSNVWYPVDLGVQLSKASRYRFRGKQVSKLRHVFKSIMIRLDTSILHSIEFRYFTIAVHYFEAKHLYSRGLCCNIWVELVAAFLPSHSVFIMYLVSFFSNVRQFFFQRTMVPQSSCINVLEAFVSFFNALHFETDIVTGAQSTFIGSKSCSEKDFA